MVSVAVYNREYRFNELRVQKEFETGNAACFYISQKNGEYIKLDTDKTYVWDAKVRGDLMITAQESGVFVWDNDIPRQLSGDTAYRIDFFQDKIVAIHSEKLVFYSADNHQEVLPLDCMGPHTCVAGDKHVFAGLINGDSLRTDGKTLIRITGHPRMIRGMAYFKGMLATTSDNLLSIWDDNLKLIHSTQLPVLTEAISFSPCGAYIVLGDATGQVRFFDTVQFRQFYSILLPTCEISSVKVVGHALAVARNIRDDLSKVVIYEIPFMKFMATIPIWARNIDPSLFHPRLFNKVFLALS